MALLAEPAGSKRRVSTAFLERLPLGALPGPRRFGVETYSHLILRAVQCEHVGLAPLQRSLRPVIPCYQFRRESKYRNMPRQKLHATAVFLGVAFFLGVEASWADWGRRRLAGWCSGGRASLKRSA